MKAADFAKILKKIIKEEVRTVIRQELREALKTNKKPVRERTPTKDIQSITHAPVTQQPIHKTGNISLDNILKETANAVKNGSAAMIEDEQEYPEMASQFTADQAQGFGHMAQQNEPLPASPTINPNDPTSAFMKDYSTVLKQAEAINSKK